MNERRGEYDDAHIGEKPVPWPTEQIEQLDEAWGAEEIKESINDCRGCSHEHGLCDHHQGQIEGYNEAVADMTREFDITKEDVS